MRDSAPEPSILIETEGKVSESNSPTDTGNHSIGVHRDVLEELKVNDEAAILATRAVRRV
jgi:hypothetical protein